MNDGMGAGPSQSCAHVPQLPSRKPKVGYSDTHAAAIISAHEET